MQRSSQLKIQLMQLQMLEKIQASNPDLCDTAAARIQLE